MALWVACNVKQMEGTVSSCACHPSDGVSNNLLSDFNRKPRHAANSRDIFQGDIFEMCLKYVISPGLSSFKLGFHHEN